MKSVRRIKNEKGDEDANKIPIRDVVIAGIRDFPLNPEHGAWLEPKKPSDEDS